MNDKGRNSIWLANSPELIYQMILRHDSKSWLPIVYVVDDDVGGVGLVSTLGYGGKGGGVRHQALSLGDSEPSA